MRFLHVVGARPNFMKMAPVHAALERLSQEQTVVHTGQHYDAAMSDVFFQQLNTSKPDYNLEIGSGSHAVQTATAMMRIEPVFGQVRPDWVLVYGDVNSTVAAALVAVKMGIPVAHVEAGLRSRDRSMPEEHNRIATDHLADLLFTPSEDGDQNLRQEGIPDERIHFVGNVMIDTLVRLLPLAKSRWPQELSRLRPPYALVTLHRPSNVDDPESLALLMSALEEIAGEIPVIFPMHPRTRDRLGKRHYQGVNIIGPLGYLEFLSLQSMATAVITDSGGIQEETTYLGIPCLTLRPNTERPVTISIGTNELVKVRGNSLNQSVRAILSGQWKKGGIPPLWDGRTAERIAGILTKTSGDLKTPPKTIGDFDSQKAVSA